MYIAKRSHFPSFTPFRSSTKRSLPNNFDLISQSFDESVLRRLKSLTPISTDPLSSSSISLSWLSQAVDFLSTTHAEAQALITNLSSSSEDDVTSLYLDGTVKILDVCNSIFFEIERLRQRRLVINFVLHLLEFAGQLPAPEKLRRAKELLSDWENKPMRKRRTLDLNGSGSLIGDLVAVVGSSLPPRGKISSAGYVIHRTICAVYVLTVFVAGVAVAALKGVVPDDTAACGFTAEFLWSESLRDLNRRFVDGEKAGWALEEVGDVEKRVRALRDVINGVVEGVKDEEGEGNAEKLGNAVKEVGAAMGRFSEGLDRLADGVDGTFRRVLCSRNGMLEECRKSLESCDEKCKPK